VSGAYYNERDPYAARWLENLIDGGHIAPGIVDCRDVREVQPRDLEGFTQVHLFAGIGVWSHALRAGGWPDGRAVWSASCPCQPFSCAGRGGGFTDERHLWPEVLRLLRERRPDVVVGEQVSSRDGLAWLDLVCDSLEDEGYAVGALDTCAAGVGAPHIRQRLYWMAHAAGEQRSAGRLGAARLKPGSVVGLARPRSPGGVADSDERGWVRDGQTDRGDPPGGVGRVAAAEGSTTDPGRGHDRAGPVNGLWRSADWLLCRDGRWRAAQAGTQPLAAGVAGRVGMLRAYGNALCAPQAEEFVRTVRRIL
jgi:DNA (cytosine-5)-methyltransferase 1